MEEQKQVVSPPCVGTLTMLRSCYGYGGRLWIGPSKALIRPASGCKGWQTKGRWLRFRNGLAGYVFAGLTTGDRWSEEDKAAGKWMACDSVDDHREDSSSDNKQPHCFK